MIPRLPEFQAVDTCSFRTPSPENPVILKPFQLLGKYLRREAFGAGWGLLVIPPFVLLIVKLLMASKQGLSTGSEVGVVVGSSELKRYDNDTMKPTQTFVMGGVVPSPQRNTLESSCLWRHCPSFLQSLSPRFLCLPGNKF